MAIIHLAKRIAALEEKKRPTMPDACQRMRETIIGDEVDKLAYDERYVLCREVHSSGGPLLESFSDAVHIRLAEVSDEELDAIGRLSDDEFWEMRRKTTYGKNPLNPQWEMTTAQKHFVDLFYGGNHEFA